MTTTRCELDRVVARADANRIYVHALSKGEHLAVKVPTSTIKAHAEVNRKFINKHNLTRGDNFGST